MLSGSNTSRVRRNGNQPQRCSQPYLRRSSLRRRTPHCPAFHRDRSGTNSRLGATRPHNNAGTLTAASRRSVSRNEIPLASMPMTPLSLRVRSSARADRCCTPFAHYGPSGRRVEHDAGNGASGGSVTSSWLSSA